MGKAILLVGLLLLAPAEPSTAQTTAVNAAANRPVTVEYYYRIKWGSAEEFKRLYDKNHAPLLREAQKAGYIRSMRMEEPFTHLAGGPRWDLRVTITYRDAAAAINDAQLEALWTEATPRLFPDKKTFDAEEDRRFSLLEEHWDVIISEVK